MSESDTVAVSGWQPIDTAPKNGTRVLLGGGRYFCDIDGAIEESTAARWLTDAGAWLVVATESGYVQVHYTNPTHWTPLPVAPVGKAATPPCWQPIDTAPKDGTEVLTFEDGSIGVASFSPGWQPDGAWVDRDGCPAGEPTHWMPLPAAP